MCQITTRLLKDKYAIALNDEDFEKGSLKKKSNIRPNRIFTADSNIILYKIGCLGLKKINEVIDKIVDILKAT